MSVVRDWARSKGYEVGRRGHIAQSVIDAFNKAHRNKVAVNRNPMHVRVLEAQMEALSDG